MAIHLQPVHAVAAVVHIGQRRAVGKRRVDPGDAAGDGHIGQAGAACKGGIADTGDTVGDGHACQRRALAERTVVDTGDASGDGHVGQTGAVGKCAGIDGGRTAGDMHALQAAAAKESTPADAGHTGRDGHAGQIAAAGKHAPSDTCHAVLDDDRLDRTPVSLPRRICGNYNIFICIRHPVSRHLALAADGQRTVIRQAPRHVVAAGTAVNSLGGVGRVHQPKPQRDGAEQQHRCQQDGQESFFQMDLPLSFLCRSTRFYRPIIPRFCAKTICWLHSMALFLIKNENFPKKRGTHPPCVPLFHKPPTAEHRTRRCSSRWRPRCGTSPAGSP